MAARAGEGFPPGGVRVYLGLGSNLGDRAWALAHARALLDTPDLRIVAVSKIYETLPWGVPDQPRFLNQVIEGRTRLSPREVLERCHAVEARLGRVRSTRWGARTIDVDILLYGTLQVSEPDLTIPHPSLPQRAFALVPLAELDPGLRVPGADTVRALLDALPDRGDVREYQGDPEPPAGADSEAAVRQPMSTDRSAIPSGRGRVLTDLGTRVVGRYIRWYDSVSSTNDLALGLAQIPVPEGTVVIAEEQTAGRGRLGRPWASPRGGVWLSVILSPGLPADKTPVIGLAAAIAAAKAIRETTGLLARLKWPNDVLVDAKKVVGVLAETPPGPDWVVVGIGINANIAQGALPTISGYPATSLQALLGHAVDREALIRALLRELDHGYVMLRSAGARAILRRWREMSETLGRAVCVEMLDGVISGTAHDLDEAGALLIQMEDGTIRRVVAGDVRVREAGR